MIFPTVKVVSCLIELILFLQIEFYAFNFFYLEIGYLKD